MNEMQTVRDDAPLVLILGLGETGVAAARWCAREGARLRVADTRAEPGGLADLRSALESGGHQVEYRLGCGSAFDAALLDGVSQLVLSPGLVPGEEPTQSLLAAARERGVEIVGEIELFARALAMLAETREYRPRLLAVTGTNGKTTVTSLTRHLVQACGLSARAAGNISPAALTALERNWLTLLASSPTGARGERPWTAAALRSEERTEVTGGRSRRGDQGRCCTNKHSREHPPLTPTLSPEGRGSRASSQRGRKHVSLPA